MQIAELFYSVFWISCFSIIWFYTDAVLYYCNLLNFFPNLMQEYTLFINENPQKYFPDFLYYKFSSEQNRFIKFFIKMVSCVFCLSFWLAVLLTVFFSSWKMIAPAYVLALAVTLKIKNLT